MEEQLKTLNVTSVKDLKEKVSDVEVVGNGDLVYVPGVEIVNKEIVPITSISE